MGELFGKRYRIPGILLCGAVLATGCSAVLPASKPASPSAGRYEPPDERFVFFSQGKMEVLSEGIFAIGYVAALLDADHSLALLIVGHGDPRVRPDISRDLSFRRAHAVRRMLVDHGIDNARIQMAAPREQLDSALDQVGRRADLFVFDPRKEDIKKRLGIELDVKTENSE